MSHISNKKFWLIFVQRFTSGTKRALDVLFRFEGFYNGAKGPFVHYFDQMGNFLIMHVEETIQNYK